MYTSTYRDSIMFHDKFFEVTGNLTFEEFGILIHAIYAYSHKQELPNLLSLSHTVEAMLPFFTEEIDHDRTILDGLNHVNKQ